MFLTDITSFIDDFMNFIVYMFGVMFVTLDSITFHNVSLLEFSLALVLITIGLTIFVNIVKISGGSATTKVKSSIRKG